MERLSVENFLGIKQADLEVAKFTVIIGPQASGKSVLVKLVQFFRASLLSSLGNFAPTSLDIERVQKEWVGIFYTHFPAYSWGAGAFQITYAIENLTVQIVRSSHESRVEIAFENIDKLSESINAALAHELEVSDFFKIVGPGSSAARKAVTQFIEAMFYKKVGLAKPLFIPAGRSFLSILQRNAFTVFREDLDLDPFMWDMGARLETLKRSQAEAPLEDADDPINSRVQELVDLVMVGKYRHADDQDWIDSDGRTVKLSHASSGQQEALPMLLLLSSPQTRRNKTSIVIEEPEAHLFPDSQRHIVRLLALLQRRHAMQFLVTTHSPYILTALNNLIIAEEVSEKLGEDSIRDVVGGDDFLLPYEDVRAYTIQDGRLVSILDEESRLIGVNVIDGVSEILSEEFDQLLDLRYQEAAHDSSE